MAQYSRLFAVAALATASLNASVWSSPLKLNTTWLDANAVLTLDSTVQQTLAVTGISATAGGKAAQIGEGAFNLPVTQATLDIKLLPPKLSILGAEVKGSSLNFYSSITQSNVSLADLSIDFNSQLVSGNLVTSQGSTRASLFTFSVTEPLSFSLKDGISFQLALGNIHFTDEAAQSFADALKVPSFLVPVLKQLNFGTIDTKVVPWFRSTVVSVPEPSSHWLFLIALPLVALARRRYGTHASLSTRFQQ